MPGLLEAIGNVVDVPGSVVRDVLTLNNPLDQLLPWNWFSQEGRASGSDINRQFFGTDKGGWLTELATDPLTWFGVGALTKGAKLATSTPKLLRALKGVNPARLANAPLVNRIAPPALKDYGARMALEAKSMIPGTAKELRARLMAGMPEAAKESYLARMDSRIAAMGDTPWELKSSRTPEQWKKYKDTVKEISKLESDIPTRRALIDEALEIRGIPNFQYNPTATRGFKTWSDGKLIGELPQAPWQHQRGLISRMINRGGFTKPVARAWQYAPTRNAMKFGAGAYLAALGAESFTPDEEERASNIEKAMSSGGAEDFQIDTREQLRSLEQQLAQQRKMQEQQSRMGQGPGSGTYTPRYF